MNKDFSGYANVFHIKDHKNDIVLPNAFTYSTNTLPVFLEHDYNKQIGEISLIKQDTYGLYVSGNLSHPLNKNLYSMSIGFIVKDSYKDKQNNTRYIKQAELIEVSFVKKPANLHAKILKIK